MNIVGEHLKYFLKAGKVGSVHFLNLKPNVIDAEKRTKVKVLTRRLLKIQFYVVTAVGNF